MPKIIKIDQCFTKLFKKYKWHFMDHGVELLRQIQSDMNETQ